MNQNQSSSMNGNGIVVHIRLGWRELISKRHIRSCRNEQSKESQGNGFFIPQEENKA